MINEALESGVIPCKQTMYWLLIMNGVLCFDIVDLVFIILYKRSKLFDYIVLSNSINTALEAFICSTKRRKLS
jgi:hypothetical protein